ncbi:hypothetical protein GF339_01810 [candidate division KSB3 bacterium]|uniref:Uncharacterized protein n=1 Tax=candidate division KSB3 bacterium TaxID=2044937 RepID=A0A9D5JSN9_9BACT|nr:hypothetical protein [candidate division KSB3 bacterium]MBD3323287.1 hypothetical protein [candidate division KSB3 bacterium]
MQQYIITSAAGKRLIARAVAAHPAITKALQSGTVVVIAGTTNGYVAEEILKSLGQAEKFDRRRFFRGITLPPGQPTAKTGRLPDESEFPGDVIIVQGVWQPGTTIFDVVDDLQEGDVVLKGANAIDLDNQRAGILIGHPKGGTIGTAIQAVIGRRVRLMLPAGLEKRLSMDLDNAVDLLNTPGAQGPRMWPASGEIITELHAIALLTGAIAELIAAGGVCGAEGSVRLAVSGTPEQEAAARKLLDDILAEPPFSL